MDIYVNCTGYMEVPWELDIEIACRIVSRNGIVELKRQASMPDCGFADYYLMVYHLAMAGF